MSDTTAMIDVTATMFPSTVMNDRSLAVQIASRAMRADSQNLFIYYSRGATPSADALAAFPWARGAPPPLAWPQALRSGVSRTERRHASPTSLTRSRDEPLARVPDRTSPHAY